MCIRDRSYGKLDMSPERIARYVDGVNRRVYGQDLPVNVEHQGQLSGAVGWIKAARINADGSADGRVEWTDRGQKALAQRGHRYVSPEWFDSWRDNINDTVHADVLIGAAITTRPYFKEGSLRPLLVAG